MGCFWVKIIAWAIKIDGHEKYRIEPILLSVSLGLNEEHLFGQAVRSIGFFRVAILEVFFFKGDGSMFWVTTDGSKSYDFFSFSKVSFVH